MLTDRVEWVETKELGTNRHWHFYFILFFSVPFRPLSLIASCVGGLSLRRRVAVSFG